MRFLLYTAAVGTALLSLAPTASQAQFQDLVRRIPDKANTMILINVDQVHNSPLATKEDWRAKHEKEFSAGLTILPPSARKFVMAAELDFEFMRPIWELSLMNLKYEPDLTRLAARLGGEMDNIAGESAALLPGDHLALKFGPAVAALVAPANRQRVGIWVNRVNAGTSGQMLSPYLKEAENFAESGAPIIMALDLRHVVSPAFVRSRLEQMESVKGREKDFDKIAEQLASIRGIMLGITVTNVRYGKIKVDFEKDVSDLENIAKPMLLEILGHRGAMIDEFENWTAKAQGNQVTLEGNLYQSGMRRILSLLDTPPSLQPPNDPKSEAQAEESMVALATQQYYQNVVKLLDDLRSKRKSDANVTWGQVGMWFERYARKIERMPIYNVDNQMLDWGTWVADQLRNAEQAMKGIGARSSYRQTQLGNSTSTYTWGAPVGVTRWGAQGFYGYANVETRNDLKLKSQARANIRTQEKIRGNSNANLIMQGIEHSMADIRRQMTEKYKIRF